MIDDHLLTQNVLGRDAGVITVIPSPTEEDGKTNIEKADPRFNEIYNKLIRFYKRFGFQKLSSGVWGKNPL